MANLEKVIKDMQFALDGTAFTGWGFAQVHKETVIDAIELLKEREPAKGEKPIRYGLVFWKCNACSMIITEGDKFCRECGKAVEWDAGD